MNYPSGAKKRKIAKEKAVRQAEAIENVPKIDTFFKKPHIDSGQSQNSNLIHLSHDALPGTSRTNLEGIYFIFYSMF